MTAQPTDAERREGEPARRARLGALDSAIGELAAHLNAATCRLLELLAELDAAAGWADDGARSPGQWLAWRCGISPAAAKDHLAVARRLQELPAITAAFSTGEISFWQARALCRVATAATEQALLDIARHTTAAQLERVVGAFRAELERTELERANARYENRALSYHFDDDGFLVLRARLTPEDGAVFVKALESASRALEDERKDECKDELEPQSPERLRADALTAMASASLGARETSSEAYQAVVHVDLASLQHDAGERCELQDGPAIASETARRICCDATIVAIVERDGEILDVGRRTRTVAPRMRRALEARDRSCRFPGCNATRFTQAHHISHWIRGGETKLPNLLRLCTYHHRAVHEGGFRVEGQDVTRVCFYSPQGRALVDAPAPSQSGPSELQEYNARNGIEVSADTCKSRWDGEPVDVDLCTFVLLQEAGLLSRPPPGGETGPNAFPDQ